jgi:hypothetical protein
MQRFYLNMLIQVGWNFRKGQVPGALRSAALADVNSTSAQQLQTLQEAARARGVELSIYRVTKAEEIASNRCGEKFRRGGA